MADINMFKKLPYFVTIKGKKYKINTDFRHIIQIENKILDRGANNTEKICWCLEHFYPFFYKRSLSILYYDNELFKEAFNKMKWFYQCGRENYHKSKGKGKRQKPIFSYKYDDEYIWSAFYEKYRVDLTKDKIHWWKFQAMIKSLNKTKFNDIQSYRNYSGDDKEMKELKKYWELPISKDEQKEMEELYNMLK